MIFRQITIFIAFSLTCLISAGCSDDYTRIHSLKATLSEAPEVHGANTSMDPHSGTFRFTGKVNTNRQNDIKKQEKYEAHSKTFYTDVTYIMGGNDFTAKTDFFYKLSGFFIGTGAGYKDGIFHHFLLGANLQHVEFGLFFGLFHQYSDLEYKGSECKTVYHIFSDNEENCNPLEEHHYIFSTSPFAGVFTGIILGNTFLNYSASVYSPSIDINDYSLNTPFIISNYFTLGYRFNRWVEMSVGSILTYVSTPLWYYGFTIGASLYL
ncbi:hypothetical protein [uncultured Fibrobacter sp.]|uniref:hypothetical protein n=1 Tax=uncultured Fibrobacter sp. TaxID=261512 RepID=UPI0025FA1222|nr:hypothetical protein [uncultured Fibrobacter sp.]MBR3670773.1 hypothetical protein [Fibrobacter sp.]